MSPEAQQIAIAEALGFKKGCFSKPFVGDAPDYLNDLNAMHEAEMTLSDSEFWPTYYDNLSKATGGYNMGQMIRATASQRAEAFLRTKGLWKD